MALLAGAIAGATAQASAPSVASRWMMAQPSTLTPTPPAPEIVLFSDDFETYSQRWEEKESPKASVAYHNGALNLRVVAPGISLWSVPDFDTSLRDYRIEATVNFHEGSPDAQFGFVLDYQQEGDVFYALVVATTGEWQFLRYEDAEWVDLTPLDAEAIERNANEPVTQVGAQLTAERAHFYVDGVLAGEVSIKDDLAGGVFGLIARAERGYIDVSFDDVRVTSILGEEAAGS
jgi:hypothetical protein